MPRCIHGSFARPMPRTCDETQTYATLRLQRTDDYREFLRATFGDTWTEAFIISPQGSGATTRIWQVEQVR